MNNFLSVIVALVMVFSSIGGMTANIEGPVSFDARIGVDGQSVLALANTQADTAEETAQAVTVIEDILNAVSLTGVADKDTAELDLYTGTDVLLSVGVKNAEEGATIASSLLGNQVIFVSAQMVQMMQQQMQASIAESAAGSDTTALMSELQNLDKEQIAKDCTEIGEALKKAFEEKKGETVTGEITVDDLKFTSRTPVDLTYTEFMNLLLSSAKELLGKESFRPIVQAAGKDKDLIAEIDKAIEKLNSQPDDEKPEAQFTIYTDDAGNNYHVCDLVRVTTEEETARTENMHIGFGDISGLTRINCSFDQDQEKMNIAAALAEDKSAEIKAFVDANGSQADILAVIGADGNVDMTFTVLSQEMQAKILVRTEAAENERINFALDVFFGDSEKALLTVTGSAGKGGQAVSVFEGESITVVPFEKLMSTEDTTTSGQLSMTLAANALKAVTVLIKNLPAETAAWVNNQVKQMINPSSMMNPVIQTQQSDTP